MSANLHSNPLYQASLDLLDTLEATVVHQAPDTPIRQQLVDIQQRLSHIALFPDSASHYCKVINEQVLQMASRTLKLGATMALAPHDSIDVAGEVRAVALCMAGENLGRFKAFVALPETKQLGLSQGLLRETYGSLPEEGMPAELEQYADALDELHSITQGLTSGRAPTDALDIQRLNIEALEGCPDKPLSSLTLYYSLGEEIGLDRASSIEMVLPEQDSCFAGLNSRGFYSPDISHIEAVSVFRQRFYEGDLKRGLPPVCENDLNALRHKLTRAVVLAQASAHALPEINQIALTDFVHKAAKAELLPANAAPPSDWLIQNVSQTAPF